jgi:hypothetical protein
MAAEAGWLAAAAEAVTAAAREARGNLTAVHIDHAAVDAAAAAAYAQHQARRNPTPTGLPL